MSVLIPGVTWVDLLGIKDYGVTYTVTCTAQIATRATAGSGQSATVSTPFANDLEVTVTQTDGTPIAGELVTFSGPVSGPTALLSSNSLRSDANGKVRVRATASADAGSYTIDPVVRRVRSLSGFSLTNTPDIFVTATGGATQATPRSAPFGSPLEVTVRNAAGLPLAGRQVTFAGPNSGPTAFLASNPITTDTNGIARVTATASNQIGSYVLSASVPGQAVTADFNLTNTAGAPSSVSVTSGGTQAASVGTAFAAPLQVKVLDAYGNPVSGLSIGFTAPGSGASATLSAAAATTDAAGVASVTAVAKSVAGSYSVTAAVPGYGTPVLFNLTNNPGAPYRIAIGAPQSAIVTTAFANPIDAYVFDVQDNAVPNVPVTFSVPATGASATLSMRTVSTNAAGLARVTATANATPGSYAVVAYVTGDVAPGATIFTNGMGTQTVAFTSMPPTAPMPGTSYTVAATGGASGNAVTFTIDAASGSGTCSVAGNVISFAAPGACIVNANQAGNAIYAAAVQQQQSIAVSKFPQAVSFISTPPTSPVPGTTYTIAATGGASGNAVTFSIDAASGSGVCSINGAVVSFAAPGTCLVNANQTGNATYTAAAQQQQSITVVKHPQTVSFTSTPPVSAPVSSVYTVAATGGASGNPVIFSIDAATTSGVCTINGAMVSFAAMGTCIVKAAQAGNGTYHDASAQQAITVVPATPVLSLVSGGNQTVAVDQTFPLPLRFSVVDATTRAPLVGRTISFAGPPTSGATAFLFPPGGVTAVAAGVTDANGELLLTARANGNVGGYVIEASIDASTVRVSLTNTPLGTFTPTPGSQAQSAQVNSDFPVAIGGTLQTSIGAPIAGVTVTFNGPGSGATSSLHQGSSTSGVATAVTDANGAFSLRARANGVVGSYVIRASVAGVGSFDYALSNTSTPQTIAFTSTPPNPATIGGSYTAAATGGTSGNAIIFSISTAFTSGACTIAGAIVSFTGAGSCVVAANQAGNATHAAAPQQQQTITVGKMSQMIAFTSTVPASPAVGGTYTVAATGGASGNAVTFAIDASTVGACSISGAIVSFTASGPCLVNADQAGNATYAAAPQVRQTMSVGKASQTVAFTSTPPTSPRIGGTYAVTATGGASGLPVVFTIDATSTAGACSIAGATVSFSGVGTCIVNANQAGNTNYSAASQAQQSISVGALAQSVAFTKPADTTFAPGAKVALVATATSGLPVTFASTTSGVCTVTGETATLVASGTCAITASQGGNGRYLAAADMMQTFAVSKAMQTIGFTKPADTTFAPGASVPLVATATSRLAVAFVSTSSDVCTVTGTTANVVAAGSCVITAAQAGDANYLAATDVVHTFTVSKAAQTIRFTKPADATHVAGTSVPLVATATSGLAVAFASTTPGVCTVSGATATLIAAGTCAITASQAGNANYLAAVDVPQAFTTSRTVQTINFARPADTTLAPGTTVPLVATATSGLAVTFASTTESVCTVSGATATLVTAGTCAITASQAGNANYAAATPIEQSFVVGKAAQAISFTKPVDATFAPGASVPLVATASSGLVVAFASTTTTVCTVSGATATIVGAGSCTLAASQAGDARYAPAPTVVHTFAIGKAAQVITFNRPADALFTQGARVRLSATASSGLAVTFASQTTSVCAVAGSTATMLSPGACAIKASQSGDINYSAAVDVLQSFNVLGTPNITATATVSPTSFSRPGTTLVFTFTLSNSGNAAAGNVSLIDARLGVVPCTQTTIVAGGSLTCTGSTVSTAADLSAGRISVLPQLTYSYGEPAAAGSGTGARGATGGGITVTISLNVSVSAGVDIAAVQATTRSAIQGMLSQRANLLTTIGPDNARAHARLTGGTLFGGADDGAEANVGASFSPARTGRPSILGGAGQGIGALGMGGSGVAGLGSDGLGVLSNSPDAGLPAIAQRFGFGSGARIPSIFDSSERPFGMLARTIEAAPGQPGSALPFRFSGNAEDGAGRFAFSASLSQFRAAVEQREREKRVALDGTEIAKAHPASSVDRAKPAAFDLWIEGTSTYFKTDRIDGQRNGHAATVMLGADYVLRPGLLVGLMAQFDWMSDSASGGLTTARDGRGWMAGPYVSARLTRNIYFDARVVAGRSTNSIDPLGAFTDQFETSRRLASAKLTGDWSHGAWRLRPSAELIHFSETQKAYTNAIGIDIAGQTYDLTRVLVGPEIGYSIRLADGTAIEPSIALKAVVDLSKTDETTAAGAPVAPDGLRGRLEAGLSIRLPSGISLRATGAYDGIGTSSYHALQGRAQMTVPLQ